MDTKVQEKRKTPRVALRAPICFWAKGTHAFNNTISYDISLGGIGCISDNFIAPQTPVVLEISFFSFLLKAIGKISWASPLPHSDRYRLGMEFLEFDPKDKNILAEYIDMQTNKL